MSMRICFWLMSMPMTVLRPRLNWLVMLMLMVFVMNMLVLMFRQLACMSSMLC